jgi:hypothetical protein
MGFDPLGPLKGLTDFLGFTDSSDDEKADLQRQFAQMQQAIEAYRPQAALARTAGLGNILSPGMVGPIQDQLEHMYGSGARFDTQALVQNPLAQGRQQIADLNQDITGGPMGPNPVAAAAGAPFGNPNTSTPGRAATTAKYGALPPPDQYAATPGRTATANKYGKLQLPRGR